MNLAYVDMCSGWSRLDLFKLTKRDFNGDLDPPHSKSSFIFAFT